MRGVLGNHRCAGMVSHIWDMEEVDCCRVGEEVRLSESLSFTSKRGLRCSEQLQGHRSLLHMNGRH